MDYREWVRAQSDEDIEWLLKEYGDLDTAFAAALSEVDEDNYNRLKDERLEQ